MISGAEGGEAVEGAFAGVSVDAERRLADAEQDVEDAGAPERHGQVVAAEGTDRFQAGGGGADHQTEHVRRLRVEVRELVRCARGR